MIIASIGATNAQMLPFSVSIQQLFDWLEIILCTVAMYINCWLLTIHRAHIAHELLQQ